MNSIAACLAESLVGKLHLQCVSFLSVAKHLKQRISFFSVAKSNSATALSWQLPAQLPRKDDKRPNRSQHGCPERLPAVYDADGLDDDLRKQLAPTMEISNGLGKAPPSGSVQCARKNPRQRSLQDAAALTWA